MGGERATKLPGEGGRRRGRRQDMDGKSLRGGEEFDAVESDAEFLGVVAKAEVAGGVGVRDAEAEEQAGAVGFEGIIPPTSTAIKTAF